MKHTQPAIVAMLVLLAVAPAWAATPVNQTRTLAADGLVSVDNLKGRIIVRTWAQPQVRITGSLGNGVEKLEVDGSTQSLRIKVKYPEHDGGWLNWGKGGRSEPSVLEVTIPQHASLNVDSVSADVDVQQMAGRKLVVNDVRGEISVSASSPGEASMDSVSGDVSLRITSGHVEVNSVSGDIHLQGGLRGSVKLESVSGDVTLLAGALQELRVQTVSGDADLQAGLIGNGSIKAETVSGDVRLAMPRSSDARVHAETFSGNISSAAGKVAKKEYGPGKSLDARLGQGQGDIHLETFSGDIDLQLR